MKTLFKTVFFTLAIILILTLIACEEDPMNGKVLKDKEFVNELYAVASDTFLLMIRNCFYTQNYGKTCRLEDPLTLKIVV